MKTAEKSTKPNSPKSSQKTFISIGSIIILILAAISFIFIPAMVQSGGEELPAFGKYNGKQIKYAQNSKMASYFQYYAEQLRSRGQQITDDNYYNLLSSAFNSTVINMAFTDEVNKSGYVLPEKLIDRTMLPYFYDTNGKYSARIFRDTPDTKKIEMRKAISEDLIYQRYSNDLFGDDALQQNQQKTGLYGLKTSTKEIAFIKDMNGKQRSFDLVSFATDKYPLTEAAEYGKTVPDYFAKYNLSVISAATKEEAKNILSRITSQEVTFEDAAKDLSNKTYSRDDGKLLTNYQYQLKNILSDEASIATLTSLEETKYSDVIQLKNGFGFFRCDAAVTPADFTSETTQNDIYSYMKINEAGKIEDYFINQAKDFATAAAKDGFDKACKAFNLTKTEVPAFPINYANNQLLGTMPSDKAPVLSGAENNENFLKTAFSIKKDELSTPIVLGSNVVVFKLNEEIIAPETADDTMNFMYPYYKNQFDQSTVSQFFMKSEKLENNLFNVYFNKILKK